MAIPVVGPLFNAAGDWAVAHLIRSRQTASPPSPLRLERRPTAPAAEESVVLKHYLFRDAEEHAAYRRLRERQVEPVLEFFTICGERLAAHMTRDFLLEVYERSALLQTGLTRDVFYVEVTPSLIDRAWLQRLLRAFFRASATAPNDEIRTLIRRIWEEMMTSSYAVAPVPGSAQGTLGGAQGVLQMLDQARQALLDYIVRGQEIGAIAAARTAEGVPGIPENAYNRRTGRIDGSP